MRRGDLVVFLRTGGHDVLYIAESAAGLNDSDVSSLALRANRLLLTEHKDFGGLLFSSGHNAVDIKVCWY